MGFDSGIVGFRRFVVCGKSPAQVDQSLLDVLSQHSLRPTETGVSDDVEYGWSGGRHILDGEFSFDNNVFAEALHFALRVDTNRVPAELKRAYTLMEETAAAAGNPSGFISKLQKREVKDVVRRKLEDDQRSGQFRRSKLTPVLWDIPSAQLYCPASQATEEKLRELFERSFGLELLPISSGSLAVRLLEAKGRRRDHEDTRPTRFVARSEGDESPTEYPWVAKSNEAKDFLGNEFLLWLWHEADRHDGYVKVGEDEIAVMIDRSLDLDCSAGNSGRAMLRAAGPARMPEAVEALRTSKVPRKCGLVIESGGSQYTFAINAETLAVSGLKLPEVPDADTPRVLFEERIEHLRSFAKVLDRLYYQFLFVRASSSWEGAVGGIRKWISGQKGGARQAALATV